MAIPEEITKTINKSDSGFLIEVAKFLESQDWGITISPYYLDSVSGKSREIDLLATKTIDVLFGKRLGSVTYNLIIECKDIRNPEGSLKNNAVFWFKESSSCKKQADDYIQRNFSVDPKHRNYMRNLHYLKPEKIAYLFESSDSSNGDNRETGTVFKAVSQALHSLIYFKSEGFGKSSGSGNNISHYLPVIIYRDPSGAVFGVCDEKTEPISDNFLFIVNYSYSHPKKEAPISEFFIVDMVRHELLQNFLEQVSVDMQNLVGYIDYTSDR